jgi:hypothetical protein
MPRFTRLPTRHAIWPGPVYPRRRDPHRSGLLGTDATTSNPPHAPWKRWGEEDEPHGWRTSGFKLFEGAATALGSVVILGLAGYSYHAWYKSIVLDKMENAFAAGYSSLELAALGRQTNAISAVRDLEDDDEAKDHWIPRNEQAIIDEIVSGTAQGSYYLITGEKGTGKTSMLLTAMRKIDGVGIAMLEAHADLEIFRIRLGKALDYEFHEDYIGGLFSFRGPRDTSPLLDIERAFNKMEKVALKRREETNKPLVLIINGIHLLRDDADGRDLLELIQQRAELWAASHLVTVVLNSDDYWITERFMWQATRLRVIPVHDIPRETTIQALKEFRKKTFREDTPADVLQQVYSKIGGRLRYLNWVARSPDMLQICRWICEREKRWLLSQCWILGFEMDDDAEDQQTYCSAVWFLAKAFVAKEKEMAAKDNYDGRLPQIPIHEAREIMTRADYIQTIDHINLITIDSNGMVQAESVAMQNAFREICSQDGFEEHLQATLRRLDELESLGRTREVTLKDLKDDVVFQAVLGKAKANDDGLMETSTS